MKISLRKSIAKQLAGKWLKTLGSYRKRSTFLISYLSTTTLKSIIYPSLATSLNNRENSCLPISIYQNFQLLNKIEKYCCPRPFYIKLLVLDNHN